MENHQVITIIAANLAVFLSFMGTSIALIVHMNRRIDALHEVPKRRRKRK